MADRIEQVVGGVYARFECKRPVIRCGVGFSAQALDALGALKDAAQQRALYFAKTYNADRADVTAIVRKWFDGFEDRVTDEAVIDAIQQDANDQWRSELLAEFPYDQARQIASVFTVSVAIPPSEQD